jgi:hypothetical protein
MNSLKRHPSVRIAILFVSSVLCVLLALVVARQSLSSGLLKKKPSVELHASTTSITYPCPSDGHSISRSCPSTANLQVALTAMAKNFNKQPLYAYTVVAGRVVGEGTKVTWDLSGVGPGFYSATVEVQDNEKHRALSSVTVKIENCSDCVISDFPCPTIVVTCYDEVKVGTAITCKVAVGTATRSNPITYEWSARDSSGADLSGRIGGQGTSISITTDGLGGKTVTATVEVKGLDRSCWRTASSSTAVKP